MSICIWEHIDELCKDCVNILRQQITNYQHICMDVVHKVMIYGQYKFYKAFISGCHLFYQNDLKYNLFFIKDKL